jgi:hypothetical protein
MARIRQALRQLGKAAKAAALVAALTSISPQLYAADGPPANQSRLSELRLSGTEVLPLPKGHWTLLWKSDIAFCHDLEIRQKGWVQEYLPCKGVPGRAFVLENKSDDALVKAVIVRHSDSNQKFFSTESCYKQLSTFQDFHGTMWRDRLNLCSHGELEYGYVIATKAANSPRYGWWYGQTREGAEMLTPAERQVYRLQVLLQQQGSRRYHVDVFLSDRIDKDWRKAEKVVQAWKSEFVRVLANGVLSGTLPNERRFFDLVEERKAAMAVREQERIAQAAAAERKAREEDLAKQQAELERQRTEVARQDAERKEAERLALEAAERERVAKAEAAEQRRIAAEVARKKAEREEAQRLAQEAAERERVAKAQAEEQRRRLAEIARQEEELRRQEAARAEAERLAKEAAEKERMAKEEAERQRIAAAAREVESAAAQLKRLQEALNKLKTQTASAPSQPVAAKQAPRHALVIGNAGYTSVGALGNAVTDAQAFAKALSGFGFQVSLHTDIKDAQFKQAVLDFKNQVQTGSEVVFYYAGHGVQFGTANYLLPVDVGAESSEGVKGGSVELQQILNAISEKQLKFTLAVVDACRDNPFAVAAASPNGRSLADNPKMKAILESKGVTPTNTAAIGQMVIYSASEGQQALDSLGPNDRNPNGLFTRVFLEKMSQPGMPVDRVLRLVKKDVVRLAKSVNHDQVPALYDQTVGEFFFKPE